jgi:hypothetical protein
MFYIPFIHAIFWNILNVFLYKIILQIHQACLFYVISKELFGISGTLFSTIYLLINLTNFGFDYSLFAFHRYYTNSQKDFKLLISQAIKRIAVIFITTISLLFTVHHFSYLPQVSFLTSFISPGLMALLTIIFISESLKKSLELFAHLSFLNKTITIVEIATLSCYVAIVWGFYFLYSYINLYTIFVPMCITSCFELCLLFKRLHTFYHTLALNSTNEPQAPTSRTVMINQATNYINQIAKAIFSPNFIIIFLAYHLGMSKAGYIKLIIDIIILLYMLLNRAVGIPSAALMSQASGLKNSLMPNFQETFLKITNGYIQFLYALALTLIFALGPCFVQTYLAQSAYFNSILIINILLFTFAGFIEYLIITYEKLFLTQGASATLAIINGCSLVILLPVLNFICLPPSYILMPFIMIRLCSASIIAIVTYKIWHLRPTLKLHPYTAIASLIMFFILFLYHLTANR